MDKRKLGTILGIIPILTVITSILLYFIQSGPNANIYSIVLLYHILSIIGILLSIFSYLMSNRFILFITGLIGNGFVLIAAYYLIFAAGISEPQQHM